jgi:hypothetical protein
LGAVRAARPSRPHRCHAHCRQVRITNQRRDIDAVAALPKSPLSYRLREMGSGGPSQWIPVGRDPEEYMCEVDARLGLKPRPPPPKPRPPPKRPQHHLHPSAVALGAADGGGGGGGGAPPTARVVVLGPPCSGKGLLLQGLIKGHGLQHLSAAAAVRAAARSEPRRFKRFMLAMRVGRCG